MKFKIKCSDGENEWWETYTKDIEDPDQWGRDIIAYFNSTRNEHEKERTFIESEVIDADKMPKVYDHRCGECSRKITKEESDEHDGLCRYCEEEDEEYYY